MRFGWKSEGVRGYAAHPSSLSVLTTHLQTCHLPVSQVPCAEREIGHSFDDGGYLLVGELVTGGAKALAEPGDEVAAAALHRLLRVLEEIPLVVHGRSHAVAERRLGVEGTATRSK